MYNQELPSPHFEIAFQYLGYWGLWHLQSAFLFYARYGVQRHIQQLKSRLVWQFSLLETSGRMSREELGIYRFASAFITCWLYRLIMMPWLPLIDWFCGELIGYHIPYIVICNSTFIVNKSLSTKQKEIFIVFSKVNMCLMEPEVKHFPCWRYEVR